MAASWYDARRIERAQPPVRACVFDGCRRTSHRSASIGKVGFHGSVEDLERQIEQLKARKRALVQKENQRNRKRRNHALMTAGALVESCFEEGWTEIGYGRLAAYLKRHKEEIVAEGRVENLDPEDAEKRLRGWEKKKREQDSLDRIPTAQPDEQTGNYNL